MKKTILLVLGVVAVFAAGCATGPTEEEQVKRLAGDWVNPKYGDMWSSSHWEYITITEDLNCELRRNMDTDPEQLWVFEYQDGWIENDGTEYIQTKGYMNLGETLILFKLGSEGDTLEFVWAGVAPTAEDFNPDHVGYRGIFTRM